MRLLASRAAPILLAAKAGVVVGVQEGPVELGDVIRRSLGCGVGSSARCVLDALRVQDVSPSSVGCRADNEGDFHPEAAEELVTRLVGPSSHPLALTSDDVFGDLSGNEGRLALKMFIDVPIKRTLAIEQSPESYRSAVELADALSARLPEGVLKKLDAEEQSASKYRFFTGRELVLRRAEAARDFAAWEDATVLLLPPSTCLLDGQLLELAHVIARRAQPGTVVASRAKIPGCHTGLRLFRDVEVLSLWGSATVVYVYVVAPRPSVVPAPGSPGQRWDDLILALMPASWGIAASPNGLDPRCAGTSPHWFCEHALGATTRSCSLWLERDAGVPSVVARRCCYFFVPKGEDGQPHHEEWRISDAWRVLLNSRAGAFTSPAKCNAIQAVAVSNALNRGADLDRLAVTLEPDHEDEDGAHPLHMLLAMSHSEISAVNDDADLQVIGAMRLLLELGADLRSKTRDGATALHFTQSAGAAEAILAVAPDLAHARDAEGRTALLAVLQSCMAERRSCASLATALSPAAGDQAAGRWAVGALAGYHGWGVLHFCGALGLKDLACSALRSGGASADGPPDEDGDSPLHIAAAHGHTSVAELLLQARADLRQTNAAGRRPLHVLAMGASDELAAWLAGEPLLQSRAPACTRT